MAAKSESIGSHPIGTCRKMGGRWEDGGDGLCRLGYRSPDDGSVYHYKVSFDANGDVKLSGPKNAEECSTYYGANVKGYWHAYAAICSI